MATLTLSNRSRDLKNVWNDAARAAERGESLSVGAKTLRKLWAERFSVTEMQDAVIPKRTFARRLANDELLTSEEADRAIRLARLDTEACRVFADDAKAALWLRRPNPQMNNQTPLMLARSETGARLVEELLIQIDHGIYV